MARRRPTQELSSFSWKREARMSAAKERLSRRSEPSVAEKKARPSIPRILAYLFALVLLVAAVWGAIALVSQWPAVMKLYHELSVRSGATTSPFREGTAFASLGNSDLKRA